MFRVIYLYASRSGLYVVMGVIYLNAQHVQKKCEAHFHVGPTLNEERKCVVQLLLAGSTACVWNAAKPV
jgi:hypothetical protein